MKELIELYHVWRGKRLFSSKQEALVQKIVDEAFEFEWQTRKENFFKTAFGFVPEKPPKA